MPSLPNVDFQLPAISLNDIGVAVLSDSAQVEKLISDSFSESSLV